MAKNQKAKAKPMKLRKGDRVVWDVLEDVTKVFFTYNKDGKP